MTTPDRPERAALPYGASPCPMCGTTVRVVSAGEGTSHYEPVPAAATGIDSTKVNEIDPERLARAYRDGYEDGNAISGKVDPEQIAKYAAEYARLSAEQPQVMYANKPQVIEGYVNPDGSGKGNWWKG